jgi:hypothetical protein
MALISGNFADLGIILEEPPNSSRIIIPGNILIEVVNLGIASALLSLRVWSSSTIRLYLILPYLSALLNILTDIQAKVNIGSLKI